MPIIISIEGNIGSGKSTFIQHLKTVFSKDDIIIVPEPVHEWDTIQDADGKSMLKYFYEDQERNAFSFQMMAYISRLANLKRAVDTNPEAKLIVTERCLETDRNVFAKMLHRDGKIRDVDYQIYEKWFEEFVGKYTPSKYIYIRANENICSDRIRIRSRSGEEGIPVEYLKECGDAHDTWLVSNDNVIVCDGSVSKEEGHSKWTTHIVNILKEISCDKKSTGKDINFII